MPNLVIYAIPVFLGLVALEAVFLVWRRRAYDGRDAAASLSMGVGNVLIAAVCKLGWTLVYLWVYEHRLFEIDSTTWWAWALALVGNDFCFYWYHRTSHRVRAAWAAHVNHHSSQRFNLTTALRQSWTTPLFSYAFFIPLAWIGFSPLLVIATVSVSLVYQFFIHTEVIGKLGPLEWFMNTPSHHRVHHGSNPQYIDKNYGGMFIIWDRLFGSFEPEGEPVNYGISKNINTYNPLKIAFHEWIALGRDIRNASGWRDALKRPFVPPEWQPPPAAVAANEGAELTLARRS